MRGRQYKARGCGEELDIKAACDQLTDRPAAQHISLTSLQASDQDTARQSRMSMRTAVAGCVVVVCLVALLAEQAEGHITFFSPKEMMMLKKQDGKKGMEPRSEDGQFEEVTIQQLPEEEIPENTDKTVEIAVRLSAKQLDDMAPVLEEIIHDMVETSERAK